MRVFGGWISDRWGGVNTLTVIFAIIILTMIIAGFPIGVAATAVLFAICFAAFGAGNGAVFQLVPLRWPLATAVAGSMIGEIGAMGGSFIPNAMGISKQNTDSYIWGFLSFAALAAIAFIVLRVAQRQWTKTWVGKGGKVRVSVFD